jgi:hypothetical protein
LIGDQANNHNEDQMENRLNSFFHDLGLSPVSIEITTLQDADYNRFFDRDSMVSLRSAEKNKKDTALTMPSKDHIPELRAQYKLYVREVDGVSDLGAIIDSFLQVHFPVYKRKPSQKTKQNYELAFRCYDKIYNEKPLRDFFIDLCKQDNNLLRISLS